MSVRTSRRIAAYDYLRVFAMCAVVAIHVLRPYRALIAPTSFPRVLDDVLHFAVPVFFFVAGALVWSRPWHSGHHAWLQFMRRRIPTLVVPYLAWTVFYLALKAWDAGSITMLRPRLLPALFFGTAWYHLYFVPTLIVFYAATPLAARLCKWSPEALLALAVAARVLLMPQLPPPGGFLGVQGREFVVHLIVHLPDIALGAWFIARFHHASRVLRYAWPALLMLGVASSWLREAGLTDELTGYARSLESVATMSALLLGLAGGAFMLADKFPATREPVDRLAELAFGVYLIHPAYVYVVRHVVDVYYTPRLWVASGFGPLAYLAVLVASVLTAAALRRYGGTSWLVGAPVRPGVRQEE